MWRIPASVGLVVAMAVVASPPVLAADLDLTPDLDVAVAAITAEGDTAVDSSGRIYVGIKPAGTVTVFDASGVTTGVSVTGLNGPDGIDIDSSGNNLFVGEDGGNRVSHHYRSGAGFTAGATITGITRPVGVAIAPNGNIFVALIGGEVREYTVTGTGASLSFSGTPVKTITGLSTPYGLTFDSTGTLYVSEIFSNRIRAFSSATLATCGGSCALVADRTISGASTLLQGPVFMDVDSQDSLYVANYQQASILIFTNSTNGNVAPESRIMGAATLMLSPWGMAVDASNNFYTQNANGGSKRWLRFRSIVIPSPSSSRGPETPADILQQIPMPDAGDCSAVVDDHVGYETGLSGGWQTAWGEWMNDGSGGWVCSRTLTYSDRFGRWVVAE